MRIQSAVEQAGIRFLDNNAGAGLGFRSLRRKHEAKS
jgi:hypothetical protein